MKELTRASNVQDHGLVMRDGKLCRKITYEVDFGPKNGTSHVTVYDPCITEEAQQRRRQAIVDKCSDLMRRGLL